MFELFPRCVLAGTAALEAHTLAGWHRERRSFSHMCIICLRIDRYMRLDADERPNRPRRKLCSVTRNHCSLLYGRHAMSHSYAAQHDVSGAEGWVDPDAASTGLPLEGSGRDDQKRFPQPRSSPCRDWGWIVLWVAQLAVVIGQTHCNSVAMRETREVPLLNCDCRPRSLCVRSFAPPSMFLCVSSDAPFQASDTVATTDTPPRSHTPPPRPWRRDQAAHRLP